MESDHEAYKEEPDLTWMNQPRFGGSAVPADGSGDGFDITDDRPEARPTPEYIYQRNFENSRHSRGPATANGKAISRCNSLRHGLRANPASGVIESTEAFNALLDQLHDEMQPVGIIEQQAVHQIAVSVWRLQRAARIDAATCDTHLNSVGKQKIDPAKVQDWMRRIHNAWRLERVQETTCEWRNRTGLSRRPRPQEKRWRFIKPDLHAIDDLREEKMMADPAAITAITLMVRQLVCVFTPSPALPHQGGGGQESPQPSTSCPRASVPSRISSDDKEKLAWLLGDFARRFGNGPDTLDPMGHAGLIELMCDDPDEQTRDAFERTVANRLRCLEQQLEIATPPAITDEDELYQQRLIGMLSEEALFARKLRYEAHAHRAMHRALQLIERCRAERTRSH